MNPAHDALSKMSANAELLSASKKYKSTSARTEFGGGGLAMFEKLMVLRDKNFTDTNDTEFLLNGGAISLEIACHLYNEGLPYETYVSEAADMFLTASKFGQKSVVSIERNDSYRAKMALQTIAAIEGTTFEAIENNPGLYSMLLEEVINDKVLGDETGLRLGLTTELLFATLASKLGYLVLPSSARHDDSMSRERPSVNYDFNVWTFHPKKPFNAPQRKVQVKTGKYDATQYAGSITVVSGTRDILKSRIGGIYGAARTVVDFYNGEDLGRHRAQFLDEALQGVREKVLETPGSDNHRYFRATTMRGSGKNRGNSLHTP